MSDELKPEGQRPTPETDAEPPVEYFNGDGHELTMEFVDRDFARKLERQRDEWREVARKLERALEGAVKLQCLAVSKITGDAPPNYEAPVPSPLENIRAVGEAVSEFQRLNGPRTTDKQQNCQAGAVAAHC